MCYGWDPGTEDIGKKEENMNKIYTFKIIYQYGSQIMANES